MPTSLREELRQAKPFGSIAQEAAISVSRTSALLDHAIAEFLKSREITVTQYNVLRILRGAGTDGLCRAEVMERMIAKVPDATRLLDRLEESGLIVRSRGTADRRFVTTRITDAGLVLLDELDAPMLDLHHAHFALLNEADVRTLIDLLARVRACL